MSINFKISIFLEIALFSNFFGLKNWHDLVDPVQNRGVEIGHTTHKELKSMVLCYKCFEDKHHDCMGKQGLFVCECELCKKDSKIINNVMPESVKYVEKNHD